MPQFDEKIAYYELYASSIHFNFWTIVPRLTDHSEPKYQL